MCSLMSAEIDAFANAAEACVAACSACARATEAWHCLVKERRRLFDRECAHAADLDLLHHHHHHSSICLDPTLDMGSAAAAAAAAEDDDVSSSSTNTLGSSSHDSSPRETSFKAWQAFGTLPNEAVEETKWAKFPAAGLVPPTLAHSPLTGLGRQNSSQLPDGWLQLAAPDGWPLYVNPTLAATSWTRPEPPKPPTFDSLATTSFSGRVVNVQSHYAFIRTDPPILVNRAAVVAKSGKHAKRVGDIFVYRADVDFELKARQLVTFQLAEYKGVSHVRIHSSTFMPSLQAESRQSVSDSISKCSPSSNSRESCSLARPLSLSTHGIFLYMGERNGGRPWVSNFFSQPPFLFVVFAFVFRTPMRACPSSHTATGTFCLSFFPAHKTHHLYLFLPEDSLKTDHEGSLAPCLSRRSIFANYMRAACLCHRHTAVFNC